MGVEIERKFLVDGRPWTGRAGKRLVQGYLAKEHGVAIRVRTDGATAVLTVKGPAGGPRGARRVEVEVEVPQAEVDDLLGLCAGRIVAKTRYELEHAGHVWEIDVFEGDNAGLVVAEIELDDDDEVFEHPPWLGDEVTADDRYANLALAERPWSTWGRS